MANEEKKEISPLVEWAREEVRLIKEKDLKDNDADEISVKYAASCYDSALEAFEVLCDQGHSGMSINMTQYILNKLIDIHPLTPINGEDSEWRECTRGEGKPTVYQNKRYSALFKNVDADGTVSYSDNDYFAIKDIHDGSCYSGGVASHITKDKKWLPEIKMPYMPLNRGFRVHVADNDYANVIYIDKITGGTYEEPKYIKKFYKYELLDDGFHYKEVSEDEAKKLVEEASDKMKVPGEPCTED